MSPAGQCEELFMAQQMQKDLVEEIAGLVQEYRNGNSKFVKFGLRCGLALNRLPIGGGIMHGPKDDTEKFSIGDPAYRDKHPTEKDAFFAAFDKFTGNAQFLAWDGRAPDAGNFDMVKRLSEDFRWPTMFIEMIYRRRGGEHEQKLRMFFVGFPGDIEATDYARRKGGVS
jgi:hypothetical protein